MCNPTSYFLPVYINLEKSWTATIDDFYDSICHSSLGVLRQLLKFTFTSVFFLPPFLAGLMTVLSDGEIAMFRLVLFPLRILFKNG